MNKMLKLRNANNIRWGVVLTYLSLVINILVSIFYTPIMLRKLGQDEYGLWNAVSSTMGWLSLLSLGIGSSFIKFFTKYKKSGREDYMASLNGVFILIFSVIGLIALILGFAIAFNLKFFFDSGLTPDQYDTARILAIVITVDMAIGFPTSVFGSIITCHEKFIFGCCVNLFQNIFTPALSLVFLFSGKGSVGLVIATTSIDFIAYTFKIIYCFKKLKIKIKFGKLEIVKLKMFQKAKRKLFRLSIPLVVYRPGCEEGLFKGIFNFTIFITINMIISQVNTSVDSLLLTRCLGTSANAIYAIGGALYKYYLSFSSPVSSVFGPRVFKIVADSDGDAKKLKPKISELFIKLGRIKFLIQALMLTGVIFFGQAFFFFWAGEGYENSYWVALLLMASGTLMSIQTLATTVQQAENKHWVRTIVYSIQVTGNILLTYYLIPVWQEIGAVAATAFMAVATDIFWQFFYHKALHIDIIAFWKNILRVSLGLIIPCGFGVIAILFVPLKDNFFIMIGMMIAYTVIYCISMWLFGMNKYEKDLATGKIKKFLKKFKPLMDKIKGKKAALATEQSGQENVTSQAEENTVEETTLEEQANKSIEQELMDKSLTSAVLAESFEAMNKSAGGIEYTTDTIEDDLKTEEVQKFLDEKKMEEEVKEETAKTQEENTKGEVKEEAKKEETKEENTSDEEKKN